MVISTGLDWGPKGPLGRSETRCIEKPGTPDSVGEGDRTGSDTETLQALSSPSSPPVGPRRAVGLVPPLPPKGPDSHSGHPTPARRGGAHTSHGALSWTTLSASRGPAPVPVLASGAGGDGTGPAEQVGAPVRPPVAGPRARRRLRRLPAGGPAEGGAR